MRVLETGAESTYRACPENQDPKAPDIRFIRVCALSSLRLRGRVGVTKSFNARMWNPIEPSAILEINVGVMAVVVCEEVSDAYVQMCHMVGMHEHDVL